MATFIGRFGAHLGHTVSSVGAEASWARQWRQRWPARAGSHLSRYLLPSQRLLPVCPTRCAHARYPYQRPPPLEPAGRPAESVVKHTVRGAAGPFPFVKHDISVNWRVKATKREEHTPGAQADRQDARRKGQQTPWHALFRPPESVVNNRVRRA